MTEEGSAIANAAADSLFWLDPTELPPDMPPVDELETVLALASTPSDLSDAELERQALQAPGADGDPDTPE